METAPVELAALARLLRDEPTAFELFQAIRVLERLSPRREPVGEFADPADEAVRFGANPGYGFPPSELHAIGTAPSGQPRLTVNAFGLNGPQGVLPLHYSQQVAERSRAKDHALRDFIDLFNHRAISFLFRAWAKYRPAPDPGAITDDRIAHHLLDLMGLGTGGLPDRLPVPASSLLPYAGLLGMGSRPAIALEALLQDYFRVPVEVEQFVGGWYPLVSGTQCSVGSDGPSTRLGEGAVVGDEIWDPQSRVRIRIGPLTRERYDEFLPTGAAHAALKGLAELFGGGSFDFELQLVLARDEVPVCVLGADDDEAVPLGWSTWLRTAPMARDPDDMVLTLQ
jgi:type VI secretion system protein ImpH